MSNRKKNPFEFNGNPNTTACVGINGGTNDDFIRFGFHEAIPGIISRINKTGYSDILVYPLFFCARHSVELGLKIILRAILYIYMCKGEKIQKIEAIIKRAHTHNIMLLTLEIEKYITIDERLYKYYHPIKEYLDDYAIDPEGDAFRYTFSTNNVPHMESKDIAHISLDIFAKNYFKIHKRIEYFIFVLQYFNDEYELGTFTKCLSREQIKEISLMIGDMNDWKTSKKDITCKYNISSNELTKAVNIIKKHRVFFINVGLENKFPSISNEALIAYKDYAEKMIKSERRVKQKAPLLGDMEIEDIEYNTDDYDRIQEEFLSKITYHEIAFLAACIEIGKRDEYFPEQLDSIHEGLLDAYHFDCNSIIHKLGFGQLNSHLIRGLIACGQTTYHKLNSS